MGIVLKKISKSYNGSTILKNLNLKINTGEFHVLLGPNGSGKTTLLSVIAGLTKQDEGNILIRNRNVSSLPPEKRKIGFVFQDNALFPHLTVFDNVAYGLRVRKVKKNRINRKVDYYLSKVRLEKEKNKFPHALSGGEKQRVALIRALVTDPEILLLDEPMSSLDVLTKETIVNELKSIQQEIGMTTVYVTHNQDEAVLLGDRVSVLNQGKIEQMGSPDELFYHPKTKFVARFVGIKNILNVSVIEIRQHEVSVRINNGYSNQPMLFKVRKYPIFEKGKEINLCIHPESITLKRELKVIDVHSNRIRGKITNKTNNGHAIQATIDIGGAALHTTIPKDLFDLEIYEKIWVCFDRDAPHPLCGKRQRACETERRCLGLAHK